MPSPRSLAIGAAVGIPLTWATIRGILQARKATQMARDTELRRQTDLGAPMPKLASDDVLPSYEAFAKRQQPLVKAAAGGFEPTYEQLQQKLYNQSFGGQMGRGVGQGLASAISDTLLRPPAQGLFGMIRRRMIAPKHERALGTAISDDNILSDAMQQTPQLVQRAHDTLKQFAPTVATDPSMVRSFLRQAVLSGGNVDVATIKLLAEAERMMHPGGGR